MKDKPFALVGVNVNDYESKTLKDIMEKANLPWRSFKHQRAILAEWNPLTPTFYALDHRGVIRQKWAGGVGADAMDAALTKLIAEAERFPSK